MADMHKQFERFIELKDITIAKNGRMILNIPHALIPVDRITACIGANGAGKTTLLKLLAGLIEPDTGTVTFSFDQKTALVLHHTPMIKASTRANMGLVRDVDASITDQEIDEALAQVDLSELAGMPAHRLSAGERQKLCLSRALLQKPNVVLLDEPTANLDPNATEQVEKMIHQFHQNGADLLFSSHQLAQVHRLADYILFMDRGEIKEEGPANVFFADPQTSVAKHFLQQELVSKYE